MHAGRKGLSALRVLINIASRIIHHVALQLVEFFTEWPLQLINVLHARQVLIIHNSRRTPAL